MESTWRNYDIAFNMYSSIHSERITAIRAQELQACITAQSSKSRTTVGNMRAIIRGMWAYAVSNEYVEKDITQSLIFDFTEDGVPIHTRFTDKEIQQLWEALYALPNKDNTAFKIGGNSDVTEDVYTEKTLQQLITEVNKLPLTF